MTKAPSLSASGTAYNKAHLAASQTAVKPSAGRGFFPGSSLTFLRLHLIFPDDLSALSSLAEARLREPSRAGPRFPERGSYLAER